MEKLARVRLSPRLQMAADMVRAGVTAADIGTDHAYLPVYLIQNGICPGAIAADLKAKPLANAYATVKAYGLAEKIALRLSDGLDKIEPGEAADIILAGMGGDLITGIIGRASWLCDSSKQLIIQPMTRAETVREFLCRRGFKILHENACMEGGKCYLAICARYDGLSGKVFAPAYFHLGELPLCREAAAIEFMSRLYRRLKIRADALTASGSNPGETAQLKEILKKISEVLNEPFDSRQTL